MFKHKIIQLKFVEDPQHTPASACALTDFAAADIARERSDQYFKRAAAAFVLYKAVDTLSLIALHTAKTKIK